VESLAHAEARGATPIAEVIGGALTADAFHISAPEPSGRGQARVAQKLRRWSIGFSTARSWSALAGSRLQGGASAVR